MRSLLDLGCGSAELASFASEVGYDLDYTGIESREDVVEAIRTNRPSVDIRQGDLYDFDSGGRSFDLAVAIGAHIDGRAASSSGERVRRLEHLVERAVSLGERGAVVIVLDHEELQSRPGLALEEALWGVTEEELQSVAQTLPGEKVVYSDLLRCDLALLVARPGTHLEQPSPESTLEAYATVIERERRGGGEPLDEVWLWLEGGYFERAKRRLDEMGVDVQSSREAGHLYHRIEVESPDAFGADQGTS